MKALRSLPKSSSKKDIVVKNLASIVGIKTPPPPARERLSKETLEKIENFYLRDVISRCCPGRKEIVKVGNRKIEKRFLMYSLKECHAMFVEEFGDIVKLSKFASLRPENVLTYSSTPIESCCCRVR